MDTIRYAQLAHFLSDAAADEIACAIRGRQAYLLNSPTIGSDHGDDGYAGLTPWRRPAIPLVDAGFGD